MDTQHRQQFGDERLRDLDSRLGVRFFAPHSCAVQAAGESGATAIELDLEDWEEAESVTRTLGDTLRPGGLLLFALRIRREAGDASAPLHALAAAGFDKRRTLVERPSPTVMLGRATKDGPRTVHEPPRRGSVRPPTVSVVVPLYNKAPYLGDCIDSILNQDFTDWELLVVDDGSTDGSTDIATAYVERHPDRIRLLEHPRRQNRGPGAARNLGAQRAEGLLVSFLDADDIWLSKKLSHDVALLENLPEADMVYGPMLWWWQDGSRPAETDVIPIDQLYRPPSFFEGAFAANTGDVPWPCVSAVTVRRDALLRVAPWGEDLRVAEDLIFFAELSVQLGVFTSSQCLSEYRRLSTGLWAAGAASGEETIARAKFNERVEQLRAELGM